MIVFLFYEQKLWYLTNIYKLKLNYFVFIASYENKWQDEAIERNTSSFEQKLNHLFYYNIHFNLLFYCFLKKNKGDNLTFLQAEQHFAVTQCKAFFY